MAVAARSAPRQADGAPGTGRCARSRVGWPAIPSYACTWPRSWRLTGRPRRSQGGASEHCLTTKVSRVSHETIYRTLFVQARGVLKKELIGTFGRAAHALSERRHPTEQAAGRLIDAISIRQRPAESATRAVPGHSGRRPAVGGQHCTYGALVERHRASRC